MLQGLARIHADALSGSQALFTHAEDGTILEQDYDDDQIMGDIGGEGERSWQEAEAEVYLGALHDTAQSPYVPSLLVFSQAFLTHCVTHTGG